MSFNPLLLAFLSTILFSFSSIVFGTFSTKFSAQWMNAFKALVATFAFAIAVSLDSTSHWVPPLKIFLLLFFGGFIGLNLGDFFLFKAFQKIGPARTLLVFSFQPLFMSLFAYIFFNQKLTGAQFIAIFLMILCVLNISYEKFRTHRAWEFWGPLFALTGVFLDCTGVLMTRQAFDQAPEMSVLSANLYRCLGAGTGFILLSFFFPYDFVRRLRKLKTRALSLVFIASFVGTFLALWLYLTAIESGHLGKISAVVGSGPIFTTAFESLLKREWPSWHLWLSLLLFALAFYLLNFI